MRRHFYETVLPKGFRVGKDDPLPTEIMSDPWVIFHGTPMVNCHSIEADGFLPAESNRFRDAIGTLIAIYERMRWHGLCADGYATLATYAQTDFQIGGSEGALFFSDDFDRSLRYCAAGYGGSEKARGIALAYEDLIQFASKSEIRDQYNREKDQTVLRLQSLGAAPQSIDPHRFRFSDLDWLSNELEGLKCVYSEAKQFLSETGGAVYALRMEEGDVQFFRDGGSMGIYTTQRVAPDRIVGKVIVEPNTAVSLLGSTRMDILLRQGSFKSRLKGR